MPLPLFDFPPAPLPTMLARSTDPQTSHDAAAALTGHRVDAVKRNILTLFAEWGELSDVFLILLYRRKFEDGISESTVRTRRHELTVEGALRDSGKRTANKRPSTIWKRSTDVSPETVARSVDA